MLTADSNQGHQSHYPQSYQTSEPVSLVVSDIRDSILSLIRHQRQDPQLYRTSEPGSLVVSDIRDRILSHTRHQSPYPQSYQTSETGSLVVSDIRASILSLIRHQSQYPQSYQTSDTVSLVVSDISARILSRIRQDPILNRRAPFSRLTCKSECQFSNMFQLRHFCQIFRFSVFLTVHVYLITYLDLDAVKITFSW